MKYCLCWLLSFLGPLKFCTSIYSPHPFYCMWRSLPHAGVPPQADTSHAGAAQKKADCSTSSWKRFLHSRTEPIRACVAWLSLSRPFQIFHHCVLPSNQMGGAGLQLCAVSLGKRGTRQLTEVPQIGNFILQRSFCTTASGSEMA